MSIGFLFRGRINNDLLKIRGRSAIYDEITGFMQTNCKLFPMKYPLITVEDERLSVRIYPCGETVYFYLNGHTLICEGSTSHIGPGYHAFVVKLIKKLGDTVNISWDFSGDETGYAVSLQFDNITDAMAEWLAVLSHEILNSHSGDKNENAIPINLMDGYIPVSDNYASYPLGYLDREWFEDYTRNDREHQKDCCSMFFPWWKEEIDEDFYKNTALTMLWCDFKYHTPVNLSEYELYSLIAHCLQEAYAKKPGLNYPLAEWMYLCYSLSNTKAAESFADFLSNMGVSSKPEIGFALKDVIISLDQGFRILTQGNMYYQQTEGTSVYWNNFINIKARPFQIASTFSRDEDIFKKLEADKYMQFIGMKNKNLRAKILKKTAVIENITYDVIDLVVIGEGKGLILNIFCRGQEAFTWAERSLEYITLANKPLAIKP